MQLKFSIVIPVYNTPRKYLEKCIPGVLSQSYPGKEIIVVDDGSSNDETLRYLDAVDDKGVNVIHKPNGGQASARNVGMDVATGQYIMFLDSDDYYITSGLLADVAILLNESQADLLSFSYKEFFDEAKPPMFQPGTLLRERVFNRSKDDALKALLSAKRNVFSSTLHNKIIRLEWMRENNIRFLEGTHHDDTYITALLIRIVRTIDRYNYEAHAFRRNNPNSLTTSPTSAVKNMRDMLTVFNALGVDQNGGERGLYDFLSSPFAFWMGKAANLLACADKKDIRSEIQRDIMEMSKYKFVLDYASRSSVKLVGICMKAFGIRFTICLLSVYFTLNSGHQLSIRRRMK